MFQLFVLVTWCCTSSTSFSIRSMISISLPCAAVAVLSCASFVVARPSSRSPTHRANESCGATSEWPGWSGIQHAFVLYVSQRTSFQNRRKRDRDDEKLTIDLLTAAIHTLQHPSMIPLPNLPPLLRWETQLTPATPRPTAPIGSIT